MSCESAHALPSTRHPPLFCLRVFFLFFSNVTPFLLLPCSAPRPPRRPPRGSAAGSGGAPAPEQRARRRGARGAAPGGAAPEVWFSRRSRAAAAATFAGVETGFVRCGSWAPSFMTARSGEPTPCEVSGPGGGSLSGKLLGNGLEKRFRARGEGSGEKVDGSCPPAGVVTGGVIPAPTPRSLPRQMGGWADTPRPPVLGSPAPWRAGRRDAAVAGSVCAVMFSPAAARGARQVSHTAAPAAAWSRHGEGFPVSPQKLSGLCSPSGTSPGGPHCPWVANWVGRVALPGNPLPVPGGLCGPSRLCCLRSPVVEGGERFLRGWQPHPVRVPPENRVSSPTGHPQARITARPVRLERGCVLARRAPRCSVEG